MIDDAHKKAIVSSWRLVVPIAETAADLFYKRLFELRPEYRSLFPEDMTVQKAKLVKMLSFIVKSLDWPDAAWRDPVPHERDLFLVVLAMGRRHSELYKIPEDSYEPVGEALMWALDYGLGEALTDEVRASWLHIYGLLAATMKMGTKMVDRSSDYIPSEAVIGAASPSIAAEKARSWMARENTNGRS